MVGIISLRFEDFLLLVEMDEGLDDWLKVSFHHSVEGVGGETDTMIGYAVLRIVIGSDFFAALAGANFKFALGSPFFILLTLIKRQNLRTDHLHADFLVLELSFFGLAADNDASRDMRHTNSGLGFVNVLAAGALRTISVDLKIGRVDLNVNFFGFRHHENGRGRRVNAALGFG